MYLFHISHMHVRFLVVDMSVVVCILNVSTSVLKDSNQARTIIGVDRNTTIRASDGNEILKTGFILTYN